MPQLLAVPLTHLSFIPAWMTKQLEVLDVAVNRLVKDRIKQQ